MPSYDWNTISMIIIPLPSNSTPKYPPHSQLCLTHLSLIVYFQLIRLHPLEAPLMPFFFLFLTNTKWISLAVLQNKRRIWPLPSSFIGTDLVQDTIISHLYLTINTTLIVLTSLVSTVNFPLLLTHFFFNTTKKKSDAIILISFSLKYFIFFFSKSHNYSNSSLHFYSSHFLFVLLS